MFSFFSYSKCKLRYTAPTFPETHTEVLALEREFDLGICEALENFFGCPPVLADPEAELRHLRKILCDVEEEELAIQERRKYIETRIQELQRDAPGDELDAARRAGWLEGFESARKMLAPDFGSAELIAAIHLSKDSTK